MASGVFGLKKVYKKQVENVDNSNLASWPESSNLSFVYAGYFGGGYTAKSHIGRLDASVDTWSLPGDYTPAALDSFSDGVSTSQYGYFGSAGNQNDYTYFSYVYRLDFSNTTSSLPGAILTASPAVNDVGGVQTPTKAYFAGGYSSGGTPSVNNKIEKFTFSNESISTLPSTLSTARGSMGSVHSESYGYFAAGYIGPPSPFTTDVIDRLGFDTETTSTLPTTYPASENNIPSTSSPEYGYFLNTSHLVRLNFNTESFTTISNATPVDGSGRAAMNNSNFNTHFAGGYGPDYLSLTVRLDYGSETISVISANYPEGGFSYAGGVSGAESFRSFTTKTIGYFMGGYDGGSSSYVKRMDFTSDTSSTPSMRISHATTGMRGVANNNFGYAMGGFHGNGTPPPSTGNNRESRLHRIDFSTESLTVFSATPEAHTDYTTLWGVDDMYGWKAGDLFNSPPSPVGTRSDIRRLDYSTESWNVPGTIQPTRQARGLIFSDIKNRNGISISGSGYIPTLNYNPTAFIKYQTTNDTITGTPFPALGSHQNSGASIYNPQYGYYSGGTTSGLPIQAYSDVYRLDLSSDTYSDTTANSHPQINGIGASSNHYGYFCQGAPASPPPFALATITKFDYSTETTSPVPNMNGGGDNDLGSMSNGI